MRGIGGISLLELLFALILLSAATAIASLSFRMMIRSHVSNRDQDRLAMAVQNKLTAIQSRPFPYIYLTDKADFTYFVPPGPPSCSCDASPRNLKDNFDRHPGHFAPENTTQYGLPITLHTCVVKWDPFYLDTCPGSSPLATDIVKIVVTGYYGTGTDIHTLSAAVYVNSPVHASAGSVGAGSIQGRVLAVENDAPLANVPVSAFSGGQLVSYTWTAADGRYHMNNLTSGTVDRLSVTLLDNSETITFPSTQDYENGAIAANNMDFWVRKSPIALQVSALQGTTILASANALTASTLPTTASVAQPNSIEMVVAGGFPDTRLSTVGLMVPALASGYHVYCVAPAAGAPLQEAANSPVLGTVPGSPLRLGGCR